MTYIRGNKARVERQKVVTREEFEEMLKKADGIFDEFLRLRAKAVLCLLRLTGKRREEIAMLPFENVRVENGFLTITFILEKKRKGSVLQRQSIKSIPLSEPLAKPIIDYLNYLEKLNPKPKFFFPSSRNVFGNIIINHNAHLTGRQIFNIVRRVSDQVWCHLFRETVAADVIKHDPTIIGAFKVMRRLDLEDYRTGFNYLKRFASDVIQMEATERIDLII